MANAHGKDIAIFLGDTDVSQYLNANAITINNELADTTVYSKEDRNFIGGLITGQAVLGGHFDQAAGALGVLVVNIICLTLAQIITLALVKVWRQSKIRRQTMAG